MNRSYLVAIATALFLLVPWGASAQQADPALWQWIRSQRCDHCTVDAEIDEAPDGVLVRAAPDWAPLHDATTLQIDGEPALRGRLSEDTTEFAAGPVVAERRFRPGLDPALTEGLPTGPLETVPAVLRIDGVEDVDAAIAELDQLPWLHLPGFRVIEAEVTSLEVEGDLWSGQLEEIERFEEHTGLPLQSRLRDRIERSDLELDLNLVHVDGPMEVLIEASPGSLLAIEHWSGFEIVDPALVGATTVRYAVATPSSLDAFVREAVDIVSGRTRIRSISFADELGEETVEAWRSQEAEGHQTSPEDEDSSHPLWTGTSFALEPAQMNVGEATSWTSIDLSEGVDPDQSLDGEELADLLPRAAGVEEIVDGRFRHMLPIEVPGGRGDFGPAISVRFQRGYDGPHLGLHWALGGLPVIERRGPTGGAASTEVGDDTFFLDGQELVRVTADASQPTLEFRTRTASGIRVRWDRDKDRWTVTDRGRTRQFGAIDQHCGAVEAGTVTAWRGANTTPFQMASQRWWLCRERDDFGNSIVYEYTGDDGTEPHTTPVRPSHVGWGGGSSAPMDWSVPATDRTHQLAFDWDWQDATHDRSDLGRLEFSGARLVAVDLLLGETQLQRARTWTFSYTRADPSNRLLLYEVGMRGAEVAGTSAPEVRLRQFRYRQDLADRAFADGLSWGPEEDISSMFPGVDGQVARVVSLNHDALPDVLFFDIDEAWSAVVPPQCTDQCPQWLADPYAEAPEGPTTVDNAGTAQDEGAGDPTLDELCPGLEVPDCIDASHPDFPAVCDAPVSVRAFVNTGDLTFVEDPLAANYVELFVNQQGYPATGLDDVLAAVHFVDINADGMDDLVGPEGTVLSPSNADWHLLGQMGGALTHVPMQPPLQIVRDRAPLSWADIDGNGKVDLIGRPEVAIDTVTPDGTRIGGLCMLGMKSGWRFLLNHTVGDQIGFKELAAERVPFFGTGAAAGVYADAIDPSEAWRPLKNSTTGDSLFEVSPDHFLPNGNEPVSCTGTRPDGSQGTGELVGSPHLAQVDQANANLFLSPSGWSYLAQHMTFSDVNADGCADVTMAMETWPLQEAGVIDSLWVQSHTRTAAGGRNPVFSEVFLGDCAGTFGLVHEVHDYELTMANDELGWPSLHYRERDVDSYLTDCNDLPFAAMATVQACDEYTVQPWTSRRCSKAVSPYHHCCTPCGVALAGCADFRAGGGCSDGPTLFDEASLSSLPSTPFQSPVNLASWEPWNPFVGHLFDAGVQNRPGGPSMTPTPAGQWADVDGDGRVEWLQSCSSSGAPDPMEELVEGDGLTPPELLVNNNASYPVAVHWPQGRAESGVLPGAACEARPALDLEMNALGALRRVDAGADLSRPVRLGRDQATLLMDLDGDGFADQLDIDGSTWTLRRATREAPELALESITYPSGNWSPASPDATSHLSWRAGDPTANPLLPFADVGVAEVVDRAGRRLVQRAGCRTEGGKVTGCATVAVRSHRGAVRLQWFATSAELAHRKWMEAELDSSGRPVDVRVRLPGHASTEGDGDGFAPQFRPDWRTCAVPVPDTGPADTSLTAYLDACAGFNSPEYGSVPGGATSLLADLGQQAFSWPLIGGLVPLGASWDGFSPSWSDGGSFDLFVEEFRHEATWATLREHVDHRHAATMDDDVLTTWSYGPADPEHGPHNTGRLTRDRAGHTIRDSVLLWDRWSMRGEQQIATNGQVLTTSSLLDSFGRVWRDSDPTGAPTDYERAWCGAIVRTTDAEGRVVETPVDPLCSGTGVNASWGRSDSVLRDGFGAVRETLSDPGDGQPVIGSWATLDRDPGGFGDLARAQSVGFDGEELVFDFRNTRGELVRRRSCGAAPGLPAGSAVLSALPSNAVCANGTEVDELFVYDPDGRPALRSSRHVPGNSTRWIAWSYDSLGRVSATVDVGGTELDVLAWRAGQTSQADVGATRQVTWHADGQTHVGPDGVIWRTRRAPLESTVSRNGVVVHREVLRADQRRERTQDVMGRATEFDYDDFGRLAEVRSPGFDGIAQPHSPVSWIAPVTRLQYDSAGRIEEVQDPGGGLWETRYDQIGRPIERIDPFALSSTLSWDDAANDLTVTDPSGTAVALRRDGLDRTVQQELPDQSKATWSWDARGLPLTSVDRPGRPTTADTKLLPGGIRRVRATWADGSVSGAFVDPLGRILREVDRDGVAADVQYDTWGNRVAEYVGAADPWDISTWPAGELTVERGHDLAGRPIWECPAGVSVGRLCTGYDYDGEGRLERVLDGLQPANLDTPALWQYAVETSMVWRPDDQLAMVVDPEGRQITFLYDQAGRRTETLVNGHSTGETRYDAMGRPARTVDADGAVTESVFDQRGALVERWTPGALNPQEFGYRPDGALAWFEDGDGSPPSSLVAGADREFRYDSAGQLAAVLARNGLERHVQRVSGEVVAEWSEAGGKALTWTDVVRDPATGRTISRVSALTEGCAQAAASAGTLGACGLDGTTQVDAAWTPAGRRSSIADANGNTTTWDYALGQAGGLRTGRMQSEVSATLATTWLYDAEGRIETVLEGPPGAAPVRTTTHQYDGRDRLMATTTDVLGDLEEVLYDWDDLDRLTWSLSLRNGLTVEETVRGYDVFGNVAELGQALGNAPSPQLPNGSWDPGEIFTSWTAAGREVGTQFPDAREVHRQYQDGLLERVCDGSACAPGAELFEVLSRDALGRITGTLRAGGLEEWFDYDADGNLVQHGVQANRATGHAGTSDTSVTDSVFDLFGRVLTRETLHYGTQPLGQYADQALYEYNAVGWLTREATPTDDWRQEFDRAGNRVARLNADGTAGWTATYGPDNQLLERVEFGGGLLSFAWDALGQRTNDAAGNTLSWTPRGRLDRVTGPSGQHVADYAYGADGRRVLETTPAGQRELTYGPTGFLPLIVEDTNSVRQKVLAGGVLVAELGAGAATDQGVVTDDLGSPMTTAEMPGGRERWQGRWGAYGDVRAALGTAPTGTTWAGMQADGASGFFGAALRDYDPDTGTWLSRDPMGVDGGVNVYAYADGDPVNRTDPSGLCSDIKEWHPGWQRWRDAQAAYQSWSEDMFKTVVDSVMHQYYNRMALRSPGARVEGWMQDPAAGVDQWALLPTDPGWKGSPWDSGILTNDGEDDGYGPDTSTSTTYTHSKEGEEVHTDVSGYAPYCFGTQANGTPCGGGSDGGGSGFVDVSSGPGETSRGPDSFEGHPSPIRVPTNPIFVKAPERTLPPRFAPERHGAPAAVVAFVAYTQLVKLDAATPSPDDAFWQKWAIYGAGFVVFGGAALWAVRDLNREGRPAGPRAGATDNDRLRWADYKRIQQKRDRGEEITYEELAAEAAWRNRAGELDIDPDTIYLPGSAGAPGSAEGGVISTDPWAGFLPDEVAIAEYLTNLGMVVVQNPLEHQDGYGRQGDALVNGVQVEFKTAEGGTDATIKNLVDDSVSGEGQAREIVIDVRGSGMTIHTAQRGAARALGISRGKLDGLTIIGEDFFFRWTPRP